MTNSPINLASFEARLQRIEDMFGIYNLISGYAPAVDSRSNLEAAQLWTEDGIYSLSGIGHYEGHAGIKSMLDGEVNQLVMSNGGAHVLSLPYVILDQDKAVATNTGRIYFREGDRHTGYRVVASRWECVRTSEGWRVKKRYNELYTGENERARQLMGMRNEWVIDPEFLAGSVN